MEFASADPRRVRLLCAVFSQAVLDVIDQADSAITFSDVIAAHGSSIVNYVEVLMRTSPEAASVTQQRAINYLEKLKKYVAERSLPETQETTH